MLQHTVSGLYCPQGDFYIDPLRAVTRAVITHAHADHARRGMASYLCHHHTEPLLRARLGKNIVCESVGYSEPVVINGVRLSLHPAGHVAGSAQVRVEWRGQVWVASGDYKREPDPFTEEFEVIRCHTFISESTFGLPVYNWPEQLDTINEINEWWRTNKANGMPSVLSAYSLGKSQHILGSVDNSIGPLYVHPAVEQMNEAMRSVGLQVPPTQILTRVNTKQQLSNALIISPNVGDGPDWMQDDFAFSSGRASGWFAVKRAGRRQPAERGFILSDHADWKGLTQTIRETECEQVLVNHGFCAQLARWASEQGIASGEIEKQRNREIEKQRNREIERDGGGGKVREFVCAEIGIAPWLFDECREHVGNLSETVALLLPKETPIPEFFGKRLTKSVIAHASGFKLEALGISIKSKALSIKPTASSLKPKAYNVLVCLMHVHLKTGGRRGFDKFTMGVWKGDELIPLANVAPDVDEAMLDLILDHLKHNTIVKNGPVRTVSPRFVFEISIGGVEPAPRRKSGISVQTASIVSFQSDLQPSMASKLEEIGMHIP